ncbi:MAG: ASKHA domain-containing protein [Proteobacteria bacterium]|nr:ASKHA domain-containing protein [Pseudomonadota bacterium]
MQVDFEPIGKRVICEGGTTLLEAAQKAGVMLTAICGGEGSCGRCIVRVMEGDVSPPTVSEKLLLGDDSTLDLRLACQTRIVGDVRVHVPPDSLVSAQRIQTEGQMPVIEMHPAVRAIDVCIETPSMSDPRSDARRLVDALECHISGADDNRMCIDIQAMRDMPVDLRAWNWQACAFVRDPESPKIAVDPADRCNNDNPAGTKLLPEVIALRPAGTVPLGLAVDIGTTKIAAYLVDLVSGDILASMGAMNPQIAYGEDVIARINHAVSKQDGARQLAEAVVEAINGLSDDLCAHAGRNAADIADAVFVGNTAMHHIFLGLPVRQLGLAPYVPACTDPIDVKAREVGLKFASGAYIHLLPNIAGFVGADHVAMLLATELAEHDGVVLGIDIGTNTEISLRARGRHLTCSTASGPAFEGAHIRHGMRAAPGAIEKVMIRDGHVYFRTVDNAPPVGLCGSGILDVMAQLLRAGILDKRGGMKDHPLVRRGNAGAEFIVVSGEENNGSEISFSRSDVTEIQLVKAAIRAGIHILLNHADVSEADIDEVIIAGAFGTYLDVQSGIDIGMFPSVDRYRFRQVGNAAGAGACMALLSVVEREHAARIAKQIEYVELSSEKGFQSEFTRALFF